MDLQQSNTDKNLNFTNWVHAQKSKNKEKENSILQKAHAQEFNKVESGEYHWITVEDKMGIKCRKLVKKEPNDITKARRSKRSS